MVKCFSNEYRYSVSKDGVTREANDPLKILWGDYLYNVISVSGYKCVSLKVLSHGVFVLRGTQSLKKPVYDA